MDIIVPICGESTRFPGTLPKWAYEINGKTMLELSLSGLRGFNKTYIIYLKKHKHLIEHYFKDEKWIFIELPEQTKNQPETVFEGLKQINSDFFAVKDCDNYFELYNPDCNFVGYYKLNNMTVMNVKNKSYVKLNNENILEAIVEKYVFSTNFCTDIYGFFQKDTFINAYKDFVNDNIYMSHLIQCCMSKQKKIFKCVEVKNYQDWGTIEDWNRYVHNITSR